MDEGAPAPHSHSLADRLGGAFRRASAAIGWRAALSLAGLIALGPLLTLAGSAWLAAATHREIAGIESRERGPLEALRRREAARAELAPLLARPGFGATLEAVARALPPEARLVSAAREGGRLTIEVAAPDPDRLRAAMRREPALERLRDAGQRQGDGTIVVRLETGE